MRLRPLTGPLIGTAVLALAAGCGTTTYSTAGSPGETAASTASPAAEPGWSALPDPPIDPRQGAVTAWTGTEALFLGGDASPPCAADGDCVRPTTAVRDGAAYDPVKRSWRVTADAPADLLYATSAVLGDAVYVLAKERLYSYDASDDAWTTHPATTRDDGGELHGALVATDDRILLVPGSHERTGKATADLSYDPAGRTWASLPLDPLGPSFDRLATWTEAGLVLTAHEHVDQPGSARPSLVRAARLDTDLRTWTRLPDSDQLGGWRWSWTGTRMVDPSLGGADGGQTNNYGRTIPNGGRLDPATGTWSRLPDAPAEGKGGWPVDAWGGPATASNGWVYRDDMEKWTRLARPDGAPADPGSGVWAGPLLVVLGGSDYSRGDVTSTLADGAWGYEVG